MNNQNHQSIANGIAPENLYSLKQLADGLGLGRTSLRTMREAGLPVLYHGRQGFVAGDELIKFIRTNGQKTRD